MLSSRLAPNFNDFAENTCALVSEPVGQIKEAWKAVPESSFVKIHKGELIVEDFKIG